jgi:NTE family protein
MSKNNLIVLLIFMLHGCTCLDFGHHCHSYQPPLPRLNKPKVAVVLGGGGAKGLAHIGVLEELENAGIKPDLIVGCSAGAIAGALYADRLDIESTKQELLNKKREDLMEFSFTNLPFAIAHTAELERFLNEELNATTFEELEIPFVAVATNLEFGDLATFGTGELVPAIMASAAFPGAFAPVKINDQYFVDGGVANPIPVEVAKQLGAEFVIAIELSGKLTESPPQHLFGVLKRSLEISYIHQNRIASKGADVVVKIPFQDVGTFDDDQNEYCYELGRATAREAIANIKRLMKKRKR